MFMKVKFWGDRLKRNIYKKYIKRLIDIIISLLAIIMLFPIVIMTALLVYINFGSPVIFSQRRPGLNEIIFKLYKFRTMTNEVDEFGNFLPDDKRLTKFGALLRRTSLDELPQLFNILKGDMSIIGPRPLLVSYLKLYNEEQRKRHDVRPGLVSLASIRGRNAQTWEQKFKNDIEYIHNISFKLDFCIFVRSVFIVFKGEGVNEAGVVTARPFEGNAVLKKCKHNKSV